MWKPSQPGVLNSTGEVPRCGFYRHRECSDSPGFVGAKVFRALCVYRVAPRVTSAGWRPAPLTTRRAAS